MEPRKYQFNNSVLTIVFGDILTSKAEVIVSSDDTGITMGGGISGCIRKAGGDGIREDAQKKLPAQLGDVVVSTAGAMEHQKFIFHCITVYSENELERFKINIANPNDIYYFLLRHSVDKCFRLLQVLDLNSIAFPLVGAGYSAIPLEKVVKGMADVMADVISSYFSRTQKPYEIELYINDRFHFLGEMDRVNIFELFAIKSALVQYQSQLYLDQYSKVSIPQNHTVDIPKRKEMKHQVFISYSRKDEETVFIIKNILDENGISYWIDKEGVFSGENYKEVIVDAIEVAKAVVFVSSANSNTSINVIRELGYAAQQRKTIIPILLDDAPYAKSIRYDIGDINQIEYKNTELVKKELIASLVYALGVTP